MIAAFPLPVTDVAKALLALGGQGSGNFNHGGRPGERGGSVSGGSILSDPKKLDTSRPIIGLLTGDGEVKLKNTNTQFNTHEQLFSERRPPENLFRVKGTEVHWDEEPSAEEAFSVEDHLLSEGIKVTGHAVLGSKLGTPRRFTPHDNALKVSGGQGSGNFGHAGRPGERGGSSPVIVYHGTDKEAATSILKEGLINPSERSKQKAPSTYVWVSPDRATAEKYAKENEDGALLQITIPASHAHLVKTISPDRASFPTSIPKEWIKTLGGKGSGNFHHEGRPGQKGGSGDGGDEKVRNERSKRALKAFKPITAQNQRHAERNELTIRNMVGGERTEDNLPVDVITTINGKVKGIEVKTLINNSNDKITMRKAAVAKKQAWGRKNHASVHTVVIDDRDKFDMPHSGHRIYYRAGYGSFRLSAMTKVTDAAHLQRLLTGRKR